MLGSGVLANVFASDETLYVEDGALAQFNPEACGRVIEALVKERSPRLLMLGWTATGMDLAAWLSARLNVPCAAYVKGLSVQDGALVISSQVYGGKLMAETSPQGEMSIAACVSGSFPAEPGRGSTAATVA